MPRKRSAEPKMAPPPPRELVLTRTFEAPKELVFQMWTNPAHLAQWWGPKGFTNPVCHVDVRPGGAIRIDMRGPDGTVYPMGGTFEEVVAPERLAFTASALDRRGKPVLEVHNAVTSSEKDGRTTQTLRARVVMQTTEGARHAEGMEAGWTESLERLAALVAKVRKYASAAAGQTDAPVAGSDREIVVSRLLDAPRELVWRAWTDPQHVVHWWGPHGFTTTIERMEVRPGGVWKLVMHGPDGADYPNKSIFREVVEPERIVFSHSGGRAGGPGVSFEMTWTFEALGSKTRLTVRQVFASVEVHDRVVREFGAIEGGKQTLERLAEHLTEMASTGRATL